MAPGLKRSIVYTLLAIALIALALLPPRIRVERSGGRLPQMDLRAARQLEWATESLKELELRDSLMSIVSTGQLFGDDSIVFLLPPRFPERAASAVRQLVGASWQARTDSAPRVRFVLALRVDSAPRGQDSIGIPRYTSETKFLPELTDGHTCVSTFALAPGDARTVAATGKLGLNLLGMLRRRGLGACVYYGAFGIPGKGMRAWLDSRGGSPLLDAGWTDDPLATRAEPTRSSGMLWWDPDFIDQVGCAAGDPVRCHDILWDERSADRGRVQFANFAVRGVPSYSYGVRTYLADMVAHYGRERFERFWTSDAPLEQAFEEATGEPIEQYTMKWAQARVGVPDVGTSTRAGPALLAVAASLVVVGGAAALTRLRQVA